MYQWIYYSFPIDYSTTIQIQRKHKMIYFGLIISKWMFIFFVFFLVLFGKHEFECFFQEKLEKELSALKSDLGKLWMI